MKLSLTLLWTVLLLNCIPAHNLIAQGQPAPPIDVPTLRVTSTLVFLDVTVLDKKGHPVVTGLTQNDFTITEDRQPQRIFSFEAPDAHIMSTTPGSDNPDGMAPVTVFVLDLLNSSFQDFAYIRYEVRKFLMTQPAQLAAPAEMMVVGNDSLEMLQGYTRSRADLLYALDHLPAALPYKKMNATFSWERFAQSIDALQQVALQNKGVPGRKNIVWVGHGGPGIYLDPMILPPKAMEELKQYVHDTTNMMVDARISLFVIYPDLKVNGGVSLSAMDSDIDLGDSDPFAGDINFGVFVNETGGKLFFNRNDVDMEIGRSEQIGSNYYTLTYQPQDQNGDADGKFRRIRVSVRDRNLRVVTKAGYFAPDKNAPTDPRQQTMTRLSEAVQSTIPFNALDVDISRVERHPDTRTASLQIELKTKDLIWLPAEDGKSTVNLTLAAVSRDADDKILASRLQRMTLSSVLPDPAHMPLVASRFTVTLRVPRKTRSVRVVIENENGGRMGTADLDRKRIDDAPALPTPEPHLSQHRPE